MQFLVLNRKFNKLGSSPEKRVKSINVHVRVFGTVDSAAFSRIFSFSKRKSMATVNLGTKSY